MRKLKTILQSKYVLSFCIICTIAYVGIKVKKIPYKEEVLTLNTLEGIVKSVDDKSIIVDNVIVFYNTNISIGDRVECNGVYKLPIQNTNFYMFNYQKFLASKKVYYVMNGECKIVSHSKSHINQFRKIIEFYFDKFESKKYLYAFILGNTDFISDDVMDSYQINGIIHLFSISGMHVGIIVSALNFIKKKWVIVFILFFYLTVLDFPPSMTRAVLFFSLLLINKKNGLNNKILFLYLLIGMLIYNPFYIYNVGFIYSYLISFFLIFYTEIFNNKKYFVNMLKVSFVIFMITAPINIQNNYYLNFLSPIVNVIFIPIVNYILFPMTFLIIVLPFLDHGYYFICTLFEFFSLSLSKIDIFLFSFKYMNLMIFILYYIVIIFVLNKIKNHEYKFIISFVIVLLVHFMYPYIDKNSYVYFIDVGQGDSALVKYPNNNLNILIDTGGLYSTELAKTTIIPILRSQGINKLDYLILTHGDYDHMGEAMSLVNGFKVDQVIFNCGDFSELEKELIKVLNEKKIPYYSCIKKINIDNNKLYFLNNKDYGNENDNSSIIYIELSNYGFLFMGDAGVEAEEDLIKKYNLQNINVLKVGHHGSKTSSSKSFVDEVNPKYSIISVGKNNRYGHPNASVLDNLNDSKIYRTDQNGGIMFKLKNSKLELKTSIR